LIVFGVVKMKNKTKGVSPVIAALLLIAISVAAAVLTYSFVTSTVRNQASQAQTAIRIESLTWGKWSALQTETLASSGVQYNYTYTSDETTVTGRYTVTSTITGSFTTTTLATASEVVTFTVYYKQAPIVNIRNTGSVASTIETIYIIAGDGSTYRVNYESQNVIPPSATLALAFAVPSEFTYTDVTSYIIRVVTDNGFIAEGTFFTPSG